MEGAMSGRMGKLHLTKDLLSRDQPALDELQILTRQFHLTLSAQMAEVERNLPDGVNPILERVKQILSKDPDLATARAHDGRRFTWKDAYEADQLLVLLFDPVTLRTEVERRVLEADAVLGRDLGSWYKKQMDDVRPSVGESEGERGPRLEQERALLVRLVNDLQWRYTVEEARRGFTRQTTTRTANVFVIALVGFSVVILLSPVGAAVARFTDLFLLPVAGLAGAWGAAFSMLSRLRRRLAMSSLDQLKLIRPWWIIVARCLIGFGAATILYFFLLSGLLGGDAFPKVTRELNSSFQTSSEQSWWSRPLPVTAKNLAML